MLNEYTHGHETKTVLLPSGLKLVLQGRMTNLDKMVAKQTKLRAQIQRGRVNPDATALSKSYLAMSCAAAPSIPFSTLSTVIPLLVANGIGDTEVMNYGAFDRTKFAGSFPSDSYMRDCVFATAAECTVENRYEFEDSVINIAMDKGKLILSESLVQECLI